MATLISILLLAVLFIAGFLNVVFYSPTNKFYAWIQSFFIKTPSNAPTAAARVSSSKEMSAHKKAQLKRVFATFDKDGDGFITKKEIRESLKNLGLFVMEREAEEMVAKFDANGDGLIDFDEFCILYETMIVGKEGIVEEGDGDEDDLKEAFHVFDKDKDGFISVQELSLVLSSLGLNEGNKLENCEEMIKRVDADGDGVVNFNEFRKMMKAG